MLLTATADWRGQRHENSSPLPEEKHCHDSGWMQTHEGVCEVNLSLPALLFCEDDKLIFTVQENDLID